MLRKSLTILLLLITYSLFGQQLNYKQGEILIQFHPKANNIPKFINSFAVFEGRSTQIKPKKCLSESLNIWHVQFDFTRINELKFLTTLHKHPLVQNVQFNRPLTPRNIPNDPNFNLQWQYINSFSMGGNPEADLDADLAWDITTGGVTVNGDTIVVVALDDGVNLNHEDLQGNIWVNHGEIPNNGIDDDGNGYIDDVNGWNVRENNGNIGTGGSHGTPVMGVMGAKGNNGIGVVGINWDVKLMMVKTDFFADEATLIEGYGYPLSLRKLYNQTNGEKGAFVVATNASWGIANGLPEEAPIWCALYDSLGAAGILSCGATVNESTNVDVEGDLPTTCPSNYLISVTNLNRTGEKEFFAGFGRKNIDIGAFGEEAYTISNTSYGEFGGTSGATPQVTGAIGLLFSAPCENFGRLIKESPSDAAIYVRQLILNGAKPNEFLDTLVATGGQLNLNNSLQQLVEDCGACIMPLGITVSNIIDVSATLKWVSPEIETSATLRYRITGTNDWTNIIGVTSPYSLENLQACTSYEFQIKSDCDDETSGFSKLFTFQTDGCCIAPENIGIAELTNTSVKVSWDALLAAEEYEVRFNVLGADNLQTFKTTEPFIDFTNLLSCQAYEYQVRTFCKNQVITDYSPIQVVSTSGCGSCLDVEYCPSNAKLIDEWISKVELNTLLNVSGDDFGYGNYTGFSTDLVINKTYDISVDIGFSSVPFPENIQAWIDFNQDGVFDVTTENIINLSEDISTEYQGKVTIPGDAKIGLTRMRITLKWRQGGDTVIPEPCDIFDYGEVEDYCINIVEPTTSIGNEVLSSNLEVVSVYPNPFHSDFQIDLNLLESTDLKVNIYDAAGKLISENQFNNLQSGKQSIQLNGNNFQNGIYLLALETKYEKIIKRIVKL